MDFTRAAELTTEVEAAIDAAFEFKTWIYDQSPAGLQISTAVADAVKAVVTCAPPCPDRTTAIRKLREARMDAISAISNNGEY